MSKTLLIGGILFILIASGFWYLFGREYDYSINFKTSHPLSSVSYALQSYNYSDFTVSDQEVLSLRKIEQQGNLHSSPVLIHWNLETLNDSLTRVTADVKNLKSPVLTRLKLLFQEDPVQQGLKEEALLLRDNLEDLRNSFRVRIEGEASSPATTCACLTLENTVDLKAMEMVRSINYLSDFVFLNGLEPEGRPRVQVREWIIEDRFIEFDFCFPLKEGSVIPEDRIIFKKEIPSKPSLKATFNGNYTNSHYAWLRLLSYAEKRNLQVEKKPMEIFYNNPQMGGDPLQWEAEIYLPLASVNKR